MKSHRHLHVYLPLLLILHFATQIHCLCEPTDAPKNLTYACKNAISINDLDQISSKARDIKVHNSFIHILENSAFSRFDKLRSLKLENCQIDEIRLGAFRGLRNLEHLSLHMNRLTKLTEQQVGWLEDLTNLTWLDLAWNRLTKLVAGDFRGLKKLEILVLTGNQIESVDSKEFEDTSELKRLYLSKNVLESFEADSAIGLDNLEQLHVDQNKIRCIKSGFFNHTKSLQKLYMSENMLWCADFWGDLLKLEKLNVLDVTENRAYTLSEDMRNTLSGRNVKIYSGLLGKFPRILYDKKIHLQ